MVIVIDTDNISDSKDSIDNRDTDFDYYDYWRNYSIEKIMITQYHD